MLNPSVAGSRVPRRFALLVLLVCVGVFGLAGCARRPRTRPVGQGFPPSSVPPATTTPGQPTTPSPTPPFKYEQGYASWYGRPYHGRQAASGEIYNMYAMTAAHRTLAFGTVVNVRNLENGQQTTVRINDRGPFVEGRIIDLSYAAAQAIRMPGIALVRVELSEVETPVGTSGTFTVQVGAFKDPRNAERLQARLSGKFSPVAIQGFDRGDGYFYRVRVGRESSEKEAEQLAEELRSSRLAAETFIVRLD